MGKELVVKVNTISEWRAVLNTWFEKGYQWRSGCENTIKPELFYRGSRILAYNFGNDKKISYVSENDYDRYNLISFEKFMTM